MARLRPKAREFTVACRKCQRMAAIGRSNMRKIIAGRKPMTCPHCGAVEWLKQ